MPKLPVLIPKKVITGCESRGDADSPYLTRYILPWPRRCGSLYLHVFHRSDHADSLHDHPWNFVTVVLWRGYREVYADAVVRPEFEDLSEGFSTILTTKVRRVWPGQILYRPAEFIHCVELRRDRRGRELPAVTLSWMSPRKRQWGFWHTREEGRRLGLRGSWEHYKRYFERLGC